jgi:RNA polymerase sigma-54 factor
MNVATISRVSNDKYVQTPWGVFEIRHFFNAGIASQSGEDVSKKNVKEQIEEIIKKEDASRPLSDQEIYQLLQKEGIKIARRTVTKYREESRILPARFRKKVARKEESARSFQVEVPGRDSDIESSPGGSSSDEPSRNSKPADDSESLEDI